MISQLGRKVERHLGQPQGSPFAVPLLKFDADRVSAEVPGSDESRA